ncbi:MAG TPA: amidohydrolase family protein [Chloroflexota bacterium]|nr:amidohydrolase family protein [Chloroflexota bacterium]
MIVDVHTHVFASEVLQRRAEFAERDRWFAHLHPPGSRRLATAGRLVSTMDAAGVDVAVALSFGWADQGLCVEQNETVLAAARAAPTRIIPFCTVQPAAGPAAVRELERVARLGCRGVGELFPDGQEFALDDPQVMGPLLEACAALGLCLLVHGSEPVGRAYAGKGQTTPDHLFRLAQLAASVAPQLPIICAHLGGGLPFYELMPDVSSQVANLYYDTAAAAYLYEPRILSHLAAIAPQRLLFGSDYPVIGIQRMIAYAESAGLAPEAHAALMGGNAATLLNLSC